MLPEMIGGLSPFDQIARTDDRGEHWMGRELMPVMDYRNWEDFRRIVERARRSAENSGHDADQAFSVTTEKGTGGRAREDFRLTRFAAYLVAMNGDPNKFEVAAAQAYFAIKTREAEAEAGQELTEIEAARRYVAALEAKQELQNRVAILAPKAEQAEQHRAADGLVAVGDFANKLKAWAKQHHGVDVKHREVWDFLAEVGLLIRGNTVRHNHPTAEAVKRDHVRLKEGEVDRSFGKQATTTPRLTPAGEGYAWDRAVKRIETTGALSRKAVAA